MTGCFFTLSNSQRSLQVARMSVAICGIVLDQPRRCSRMPLRSSGLLSSDKANAPPARLQARGPLKRAGCASFFVPSQTRGQSAGRRWCGKWPHPWRAGARYDAGASCARYRRARARRRSTAAFDRVRVAHESLPDQGALFRALSQPVDARLRVVVPAGSEPEDAPSPRLSA